MEDLNQDFDELEVLELVAKALGEDGEAFKSKVKVSLSFGDSSLLEKLDRVLSQYLNKADVQMVLSDLRSSLSQDLVVDKSLENLHILTKNCRKCPEVSPGATIPFWNVSDPDVLFVSDTPYFDESSMEYFTKCAASAGFTSSRICMTFVNRCNKIKKKHTQEDIESCTPFLYSEIQLLKPKLIVTLGLVAACSLLPAKISMNEERGKLTWLGPWPIMPTYSPSYVIRGSGNLPTLFEQDLVQAHNFVYGEK